MNNFLLSVIVPVYNEENNIKPLFDRLFPIVKKYSYEIIFVDDGSTDKTVNTIKKISGKNSQIKLISFYRNFSHQMALSAGYEAACGDAVITIDAEMGFLAAQ